MTDTDIKIPGFLPPAPFTKILGDTIDLSPVDRRFNHTFDIVTRPAESDPLIDVLAGATIKPAVPGYWVFSVTAGSYTLLVPTYIFTREIFESLFAPSHQGMPRRSAETVKHLLTAVASNLPVASLNRWNGGTVPAGLNLRLYGAE